MSFDRIVSWTGAGDAEYERRMADLHPAALVAPWRPRPGEREHVTALFVKSLEPWLRPGTPLAAPRVSLPAESLAEAQDWLRRRGWSPEMHLLAVHPGAGSPAKRRPLADFVRLGRRWLRQERRGILVIEGPAEPGLAGELARELAATPVIHAAQLPLGRLAAVLSHCSCYSGSDSGISHLAAALGLRTQVWFNATDPAVWRPLASHVSSASSLPAHLRSLLPTGRG
jgi:ADP-heptose:LPS heptosyltransferase